jgi:hypothetical protein
LTISVHSWSTLIRFKRFVSSILSKLCN